MHSPTAIRLLLKRVIGAHFVWSVALLLSAAGHTYAANPVVIDFNNLPTGVAVTNQYQQYVTFSSTSNTPVTDYAYNSASWPNVLSRVNGFGINRSADLIANFTQPVNNLSFKVIGIHNYSPVAAIDFYVNGSLNRTINLTGCGYYCDVTVATANLGINNITKVVIRNVVDPYGIDFDDFVFTPADVERVDITSGRVAGILNGTTQNALLGADVALQATIFPSNLSSGTYSWTVTGPGQRVSASNTNPSYTVRWTEPGTYQAKVTYTRNQVTVSATVNVAVVMPSLDNFTANQEPSLVSNGCAPEFGTNSQYTLGCVNFNAIGINFSSSVHIPSGSYLSDNNLGGVKYVQRVSGFRKQLNGGVIKCRTRRTSEGDNNSGWLLDGGTDAYDPRPAAVRRFSEGSSLTIITEDSPGEVLEGLSLEGAIESQHDAFKVDDFFEMYVVYFTSTNLPLQRTMGKLSWNFGGVMVYDGYSVSTPYPYRLKSMFGGTGARTGVSNNQSITYQGRTSDPGFVMNTCPGVPTPTPVPNPIDSSRFFVRQQYRDLLNREPDQSGWNYWRSNITDCDFNAACIVSRRTVVARGFFNAAEFQQTDPAMANPPGTPGFNPSVYNPAFVRHLYENFLRRAPDSGGFAYWVNVLNTYGNYNAAIEGFVTSSEYRMRFGPP